MKTAMDQKLNLVFAILIVAAARSLVRAGELCERAPNERQSVCIYITVCARSNYNLFNRVKDKQVAVDRAAMNLREPGNVISLEDFYLELVKYKNILEGFNTSVITYMATLQYANESVRLADSTFANTYLVSLTRSLSDIGHTVHFMSQMLNPTRQHASPTLAVTTAMRNLVEIYAETRYLTNNMIRLLQIWKGNCMGCISVRRRRAYSVNY